MTDKTATDTFRAHEARRHTKEQALIAAAKAQLPTLRELQTKIESFAAEEYPYRFYHQSFKVFRLQDYTEEIVRALKLLLPTEPLNEWFLQIVAEGTGKTFEMEHNERWLAVTRPILEAYFHAKFFLDMACKYAEQLDEPQNMIDTGWGAFLYLYGLR